MRKCGNISGVRREGDRVCVSFENGKIEVQIITEWIVRIFSQLTGEIVPSKAIEENPCIPTAFTVKQILDGEKTEPGRTAD